MNIFYPIFIILNGILAFSCTPKHVIKPFTTDECSASREGSREDPKAWCHCCINHDLNYWKGGTREEKKLADKELERCVADAGYPRRGRRMYRAVRIWGSAFLPFRWRWGYGWRFGKGYHALTKSEKDSIENMLSGEESQKAINDACSGGK